MSFDTKYRPVTFDDVLGQESTVKILRQYIASGKGRHQSYLLVGQWGGGKTTLGRILARTLLCEAPTETGDPCDQCPSCLGMINGGTSLDFTEFDAATNSGKADIQKITEEIQYDSFSGRKRIYIIDESHRLSNEALDALLKPLEESIPGSEDKGLVCIFCTTEPEKMRATIFSRCAPAFLIQPVEPEKIAGLMAKICDQEKIVYDLPVLVSLAEITECHIRDALKALEGISMLGAVSKENLIAYMHLDANDLYLDVLDALGGGSGDAYALVKQILQKTSPALCYERLAELSLLCYRVMLGGTAIPVYLDSSRVQSVGLVCGSRLLDFAAQFASRPVKPTVSMLLCDIEVTQKGHPPLGSRVFVQPVIAAAVETPIKQNTAVEVLPAKISLPIPQVVGKIPNKVPYTGEPSLSRGSVNDGAGQTQVVQGHLEKGPMTKDEFGTLLKWALEEEQSKNCGHT